jgi:hypothetical protein
MNSRWQPHSRLQESSKNHHTNTRFEGFCLKLKISWVLFAYTHNAVQDVLVPAEFLHREQHKQQHFDTGVEKQLLSIS